MKECDSFCLNLSLTFLTIAISRCDTDELESILPGLLILHATYEKNCMAVGGESSTPTTSNTKKQWHQVSHLLLRTFERVMILDEESIIKNKQRKNNNNNSSQQ